MKKKNAKIDPNNEPWWFWGCDRNSYYGSFSGRMAAIVIEEDTRANKEAWEAIENGRVPEKP